MCDTACLVSELTVNNNDSLVPINFSKFSFITIFESNSNHILVTVVLGEQKRYTRSRFYQISFHFIVALNTKKNKVVAKLIRRHCTCKHASNWQQYPVMCHMSSQQLLDMLSDTELDFYRWLTHWPYLKRSSGYRCTKMNQHRATSNTPTRSTTQSLLTRTRRWQKW